MNITDKNIRNAPTLAIVAPCFNEKENIERLVSVISTLLLNMTNEALVSDGSFLYLVDDGSSDDSWEIIKKIKLLNPKLKALKLSRNFGHQAALLAGLTEVTGKCDAAISIDADLQQDPKVIRNFVIQYKGGVDVVLGIRRDRSADGWFKRKTALGFYMLMRFMGVSTIPNHADYRLLSNQALQALNLFPEKNIFLRAICLQLGFRVGVVNFDVSPREFGETKYSLRKMLGLALHGITSFSVAPLRLVTFLGFSLFLFSLLMGSYVFWITEFSGRALPGWASIVLPVYFIGGVQLLCLGIVGEYIGQIYSTVRNRPRWISEDHIE